MRRILWVLVALMLAVGGCGDDDGGGGGATGGDDTGGDDTGGDDTGGDDTGGGIAEGGDTITVVLDGGPDAGTYEREGDARCSIGLVGEDTYGNQYSEASLTEGLTSLQVIVPGIGGGSVSDFTATVTIGPFLEGGTAYDITSGTAEVDDSGGDSATLHIEGETDDGVGVEVDVQCGAVFRA